MARAVPNSTEVQIAGAGSQDKEAHDDESVNPGHGVSQSFAHHSYIEFIAGLFILWIFQGQTDDDGYHDEDRGIYGGDHTKTADMSQQAQNTIAGNGSNHGGAGLKEAEDLPLFIFVCLGADQFQVCTPMQEGSGDAKAQITDQ